MFPAHGTRSKDTCHALILPNITTATMKKAWSFPVVPGGKIVPHGRGKLSEGSLRERGESSATGVTGGDPAHATQEYLRLRTGERMLQ